MTAQTVRVRPDVDHTFPVFRGREATVLERHVFGTPRRPWLFLEFDDGRRTWLPAERVDEV